MVTLVSRDPCGLCGYIRKGFMFPTMRINKRSMRSTGAMTLALRPGWCPECRTESGLSPSRRWVLDPESAAEVEAYRLKRWPELASEVSAPSTPGGGEPHSKINAPGSSPLFTDKEAEPNDAS